MADTQAPTCRMCAGTRQIVLRGAPGSAPMFAPCIECNPRGDAASLPPALYDATGFVETVLPEAPTGAIREARTPVDAFTIREADGVEVLHLEPRALADGIALRLDPQSTRETTYYVACVDEEVVGIGGIMRRHGGARIRAAWVDPAHRRRGIWWALVEHRIAVARAWAVPFVETWAVHPGPLLRRGWHVASERHRNGAVHVRLPLAPLAAPASPETQGVTPDPWRPGVPVPPPYAWPHHPKCDHIVTSGALWCDCRSVAEGTAQLAGERTITLADLQAWQDRAEWAEDALRVVRDRIAMGEWRDTWLLTHPEHPTLTEWIDSLLAQASSERTPEPADAD